MDSLGMRGTLFVVGKALQDPKAQQAVQKAWQQGHEIANHTYSHPYDLFRQSASEIREEIEKGAQAVESACGRRPDGFRAPGYMLGGQTLLVLAQLGVQYDSSMLTSPLYQGVKALAMGFMKLSGRTILARLGDVRESLGSSQPYRPDLKRPWKRGQAPFLELPISSILGVPLLGSALSFLGVNGTLPLSMAGSRMGFVHLELHGVDFMDIESDGLDPALSVQRDLTIPWLQKVQSISMFLERMLRSHRGSSLSETARFLSK